MQPLIKNILYFSIAGWLALGLISIYSITTEAEATLTDGATQFQLRGNHSESTISEVAQALGWNVTSFQELSSGATLVSLRAINTTTNTAPTATNADTDIDITTDPTTETTATAAATNSTTTTNATAGGEQGEMTSDERRYELARQDPEYGKTENFFRACISALETSGLQGIPSPESCLSSFEQSAARYCSIEAFDKEKCENVNAMVDSFASAYIRVMQGLPPT